MDAPSHICENGKIQLFFVFLYHQSEKVMRISVSATISMVSEVSCCTGVQTVNDLENMGMKIVGVWSKDLICLALIYSSLIQMMVVLSIYL